VRAQVTLMDREWVSIEGFWASNLYSQWTSKATCKPPQELARSLLANRFGKSSQLLRRSMPMHDKFSKCLIPQKRTTLFVFVSD
jgi:hypothetical protein